MIEQLYSGTAVLTRLRFGPLGAHIDGYAQLLLDRGYARRTVRSRIRLVAKLSAWLHRSGLGVEDLSEQRISQFFRSCRSRVSISRGDAAALLGLLKHLREAGVVSRPALEAKDSATERILADYAQYLLQERGLSQATLDEYLPTARDFLSECAGKRGGALRKLCPRKVARFVIQQAGHMGCRRAQLMGTALRSLLRFLHLRGRIACDLAAAVPTVANWRLSGLPKYLSPQEVERMLESCDKSSAVGRRDYAILLLLARLGLRAGEILHMALDDIDWQTGELTVRGKSARQARLPLPQDVGAALASYLRNDRPRCSSRRVFIRIRAPRQGFTTAVAVCDVVRRALGRAGLNPDFKGAHLLRHSLATRMLGTGNTLAEIGEILGHQSPNTTEIYAKVDLAALRAIAQPWKGGRQ